MLRGLGLVFASAFWSLARQIHGLIGPTGILPVGFYLEGATFWNTPTVFWVGAGDRALTAVVVAGLVVSLLLTANIWPRMMALVATLLFLSCVTVLQEFSGYQSDGMLLEAGVIAVFLAPRGFRPGLGADDPPSRIAVFMMLWEWFRIYFESGVVKLMSGDVQWRTLTALDHYYENNPLPTWIGWYAEHLPHWFQAASALGTLVMELGIVLMLFFPRRVRLVCFCIVTPWEIGVILTANYTFLNYLVLSLGFLLLDDRVLLRFVPARWRPVSSVAVPIEERDEEKLSILATEGSSVSDDAAETVAASDTSVRPHWKRRLAQHWGALRLAISVVMLTWIAYDTTAEMITLALRESVLPNAPIAALDPFRIANQYGLFAVMTRGRYDIEFQGSNDGENWTPYLFRNKPQLLNEPPRIYAPYQPRFDWNLWFCSLSDWRQSEIVPQTEERLLQNDANVIALFKDASGENPFAQAPPKFVRAVLWQYWFTSMDEKRRTGNWWRRAYLGLYAPELTRAADGRFAVVRWPDDLGTHD